MVQKKRTYKKRAYKRRYKRTYRRRGYNKRRYYKPIKKPEIHILERSTPLTPSSTNPNISLPPTFNDTTYGYGRFINMTPITSNTDADIDNIEFKVGDKSIEGKKIRLKYLYIKGYINVYGSDDGDNFNCKLMVFRWKRNTTNNPILWGHLINNTNNIDLENPSTWTNQQILDLLYAQDWKNDIKINFYKKVKNLYRKYDDANNIIPFKIRVPLYDCVMSCDTYKDANNNFTANTQPSTNGLYFTFLSNANVGSTIYYKWKLYYTDY